MFVRLYIMLEITISLTTLRIKKSFNNLAYLDSFSLPEIEEFIGNLGMVFAMLGRKLLSFETHGCASGSRHFFRYFLHQSVAATLSEFLAIIFTRCTFPSYPFLVLYAIFWGNSLICDRIFLHFARAKVQSALFRR